MTTFSYDVVDSIMQKYPEAEWLKECRTAMPGVDDGSIVSAFEVLSGGDLEEVAEAA